MDEQEIKKDIIIIKILEIRKDLTRDMLISLSLDELDRLLRKSRDLINQAQMAQSEVEREELEDDEMEL